MVKPKMIVSDVLWTPNAPGPVAFLEIVQGSYEGICPWCAHSLGTVDATTYIQLFLRLQQVQLRHMRKCRSRNLMVPNEASPKDQLELMAVRPKRSVL